MAAIIILSMFKSKSRWLTAALACGLVASWSYYLLFTTETRSPARSVAPAATPIDAPTNDVPRVAPDPGEFLDAARPMPPRPMELRLTFNLSDTTGRGWLLATRSGSVEVAMPDIDHQSMRRAVLPITLQGGLAACLSIESFTRSDPDWLTVTVRTRWEIAVHGPEGVHPSALHSYTFSIRVDGQTNYGGSTKAFRWGKTELRGDLALTATPSTNTAARVPMMVALDSAPDSCVRALEQRVISSLNDLNDR
jgi:hypothetical protein